MSAAGPRREPPRGRPRINLSIAPETAVRMARTANQGRYVDFALREREHRWLRALGTLRDARIPAQVVFAAREPLAQLVPGETAHDAICRALRGAAAEAARDWGVPPEDWQRVVRAAEGNPALADALRELTLEAEAGNLDVADLVVETLAAGAR